MHLKKGVTSSDSRSFSGMRLSISIFSLLTPQPSHSQEANKIAETSSHLQQQSTLIENRNEQLAPDFQPPASTRGMRKIAKKEV